MGQLMITTTGGYTYFVSLHNVREAVVMVTSLGLGLIVKYFDDEEYGDYSGITNYTREDLEAELNVRFKALTMKDIKL